ncbi:MAG: exopolysaccharide biosynthesis polyprenyl glycosylphosphotransferase [bacterium]|nr:exopolysaccharide biosynthesis polyprenyl glycosylphosphotransferase [bacterium]
MFYASLALALFIRYGTPLADILPGDGGNFQSSLYVHLIPFLPVLFIWVIIFYLFDLYSPKTFRNRVIQFRALAAASVVSFLTSIITFYLFQSFFLLTPKTNLILFSLIFSVLDYLFRIGIGQFLKTKEWQTKTFFIGNSSRISETFNYLKENPQVGFAISHIKNTINSGEEEYLLKELKKEKIDLVVIDEEILELRKDVFLGILYELADQSISISNSTDFFEVIFSKVPLRELKDDWFVEHMGTSRRFYEAGKEVSDFLIVLTLSILLLPLSLLIAMAIKISSKGPAIYAQKRIGKNNKSFTLYKFRSMKNNAQGTLWTESNDKRLTKLGKFLRFTHLDEIPQLINILKGDISFLGPRPERVELAEKYSLLPYYRMRHIVKPGLTGWAQINFRPSSSLEEAYEKLCYDVFYIKNRSFWLDFLIVLKTIKYFFASHQ